MAIKYFDLNKGVGEDHRDGGPPILAEELPVIPNHKWTEGQYSGGHQWYYLRTMDGDVPTGMRNSWMTRHRGGEGYWVSGFKEGKSVDVYCDTAEEVTAVVIAQMVASRLEI